MNSSKGPEERPAIDMDAHAHEAALRDGAERYRALFNAIDAGFCVIEVLFDANDKPADYRFLEMNPAFEKQTGLKDAQGKRVRELVPAHEDHWFQIYGEIAATGNAIRFENRADALNRWYDVYAFRIGAPESRQVAVLFNDITARKRAERNATFLADIDSAFARLSGSRDVLQVAGEKIARTLGVPGVAFTEIDEAAQTATVLYDRHAADGRSMLGVHRLCDYMTEACLNDLQAGHTAAIADVATDPRTAAAAAAYRRYGVRAQLHAPYLGEGRWKFLLTVQRGEAYAWRMDEIQLVRELSGRIWTRLERARAEEALRESEQKYRTLFESIDEGFCVVDVLFDENDKPIDYLFLDINSTFERQTGLHRPRGKTARALVPTLDDFWFETYGRVALTGRPVRFEHHAPAMQRWFEVYAFSAERGSRKVGILFKDITQRKQTEGALRESVERFGIISKITNDAAWDWDIATDRLWWNEGVERLFGYGADAIAPTAQWWRDNIHADDRDRVLDAIAAVIDGGGEEWSAEYRYRRADGTYAYVEDRGFVVRGAAGEPIRMLGGMTDITARKEAVVTLRDADRRKDEFLATLAHELRNPLAPIRQAATIAKSVHATEAQIQWSHDVIDRQVQHMALLLDDLLDVSRITLGKLALRKERVDLQSVIDAAIESARPLIETRRHALKIDLPPEPARLDADPLRLAQVFSNLLTNAAKYSEIGGTITICARQAGDVIVAQVTDTGIGIPAEALPRMFEMFSQVQSAIDRAGGGLGIGLALSKGLVQLHGGTIEVHSEGLERGSTFTVRLPAAPVEPSPRAVSLPAGGAQDAVQPLKVLVVDDNRDAAESLAMLVGLDGHEVRTAYDGAEALTVAAAFRPDCMLLDVGMPKLNGYEVAKRLRRQEGWGRSVTLIATTGWGQREDRERALATGFDHHVTKPADPAVLQALIGASRRS